MPVTRVVVPLVSETYRDAVRRERPHFLDEPVVQLLCPFAREKGNDLLSSVYELRAVSPSSMDCVSQSYFPRAADVPAIFGAALTLSRRLSIMWSQSAAPCLSSESHS